MIKGVLRKTSIDNFLIIPQILPYPDGQYGTGRNTANNLCFTHILVLPQSYSEFIIKI